MERKYKEEEIKRRIEKQCGLQMEEFEFIGAGWDSEAFLINQQYVFKFPKRESSEKRLEIEAKVLRKLEQEKTKIQVPKICFEGRDENAIPKIFYGYHISRVID